MDEDFTIINTKTRNEKIKIFFLDNKKKIIYVLLFLLIIIFGFYSYQIFKDKKKIQVSDSYNSAVIKYKNGANFNILDEMKTIVETKDSTYSPLALYFLIDNNLTDNRNEINDLFDIVINKVSLEKEIKNLIIYKKALFNADYINENELLEMINPLIKSESVWESHALYLLAEYFYAKGEKQKSKEFFTEILTLEDANQDLRIESQKRLNRDLSD